jgi:hypothetical protein
MKEIIITYYKLPIGSIPFHEIPSLENLNLEYVYCSSFSLMQFMGLDFQLANVFNAFDNAIMTIDDFKTKELLFGRVVSAKFSMRGKSKCIKLGTHAVIISATDLPN